MKKIIELAEKLTYDTCNTEYDSNDLNSLICHIKNRKILEQTPITEEWLKEHGWVFDYTIDECVADYHYVTCNGYIKKGEGYLLDWCNGILKVLNDFNGAEFTKYDATLADLYDALELCNIKID